MIKLFEPFQPKIKLHIRQDFLQDLWDKYVPVSSEAYDNISLIYLKGTQGQAEQGPRQVQVLVDLVLKNIFMQISMSQNPMLVTQNMVGRSLRSTAEYYLAQLKRLDLQVFQSVNRYITYLKQAEAENKRYGFWQSESRTILRMERESHILREFSRSLSELLTVRSAEITRTLGNELFRSMEKKEYRVFAKAMARQERKQIGEYIRSCSQAEYQRIVERLVQDPSFNSLVISEKKDRPESGQQAEKERFSEIQGASESGSISGAKNTAESNTILEQGTVQGTEIPEQRISRELVAAWIREHFEKDEFWTFYQRVLFPEENISREESGLYLGKNAVVEESGLQLDKNAVIEESGLYAEENPSVEESGLLPESILYRTKSARSEGAYITGCPMGILIWKKSRKRMIHQLNQYSDKEIHSFWEQIHAQTTKVYEQQKPEITEVFEAFRVKLEEMQKKYLMEMRESLKSIVAEAGQQDESDIITQMSGLQAVLKSREAEEPEMKDRRRKLSDIQAFRNELYQIRQDVGFRMEEQKSRIAEREIKALSKYEDVLHMRKRFQDILRQEEESGRADGQRIETADDAERAFLLKYDKLHLSEETIHKLKRWSNVLLRHEKAGVTEDAEAVSQNHYDYEFRENIENQSQDYIPSDSEKDSKMRLQDYPDGGEIRKESEMILQNRTIRESGKAGETILQDRVVRESGKTGETILQNRIARESGKAGETILQNRVIREPGKAGETILQDHVVRETGKAGETILQDHVVRESGKAGETILQNRIARETGKAGETILQNRIVRESGKTNEALLQDRIVHEAQGNVNVSGKNTVPDEREALRFDERPVSHNRETAEDRPELRKLIRQLNEYGKQMSFCIEYRESSLNSQEIREMLRYIRRMDQEQYPLFIQVLSDMIKVQHQVVREVTEAGAVKDPLIEIRNSSMGIQQIYSDVERIFRTQYGNQLTEDAIHELRSWSETLLAGHQSEQQKGGQGTESGLFEEGTETGGSIPEDMQNEIIRRHVQQAKDRSEFRRLVDQVNHYAGEEVRLAYRDEQLQDPSIKKLIRHIRELDEEQHRLFVRQLSQMIGFQQRILDGKGISPEMSVRSEETADASHKGQRSEFGRISQSGRESQTERIHRKDPVSRFEQQIIRKDRENKQAEQIYRNNPASRSEQVIRKDRENQGGQIIRKDRENRIEQIFRKTGEGQFDQIFREDYAGRPDQIFRFSHKIRQKIHEIYPELSGRIQEYEMRRRNRYEMEIRRLPVTDPRRALLFHALHSNMLIPNGLGEENVSAVPLDRLRAENVSEVLPLNGLGEEDTFTVPLNGLRAENISEVLPLNGLREENTSAAPFNGSGEGSSPPPDLNGLRKADKAAEPRNPYSPPEHQVYENGQELRHAIPGTQMQNRQQEKDGRLQEEQIRMKSAQAQIDVRLKQVEQQLKQVEIRANGKEDVREAAEKIKKLLHEELHIEKLRRGMA